VSTYEALDHIFGVLLREARQSVRIGSPPVKLRGAGGLAIGLPWLEASSGTARAQASFPKRFVAVFSACGTHPNDWFPTGGETDFQLSPYLAPLQAHRQDIVVFKGIAFVLAGRAGGAIRTGRYLVYGGVSHNNLLISMLNAMDVATNTFGNPKYVTGPLPGLLT
jgi:hypothetical protein